MDNQEDRRGSGQKPTYSMVEAELAGQPGFNYVVGGELKIWVNASGKFIAYDYISKRWLTSAEASFRLEDYAEHYEQE